MKILVTGGAGYIGSITVRRLQEVGYDVVAFDNLVNGKKESASCKLIQGDLLNKDFLYENLEGEMFDGVIHFAAYALAGESMRDPFKYFRNNILGGLNLLEFMKDSGIKNIIFSSTCSVYGSPAVLPVNEEAEKVPENVYGESKLIFEKILTWYDKIYGIKYINLRYFNAAGASLDGSMGESHTPETHIIPLAIKAALHKSVFNLFGNNYNTPDKTCIRDYIHVEDLAEAHIKALEKLFHSKKSDSFNLGTGSGHSNLEILEMVKKISCVNFKIKVSPRRKGDAERITADNSKAKRELNFQPRYSDLETIISTAFNWHCKNKKNRIAEI